MTLPFFFTALLAVGPLANPAPPEFHVPADPRYGIVDSVLDSVRFTLGKALARCNKGHLASISSFLDSEGNVMGWHDFGNLEGPGWAANAAGGAHEIHALGRFLGRPEWTEKALLILDHVLDHGFIEESGFIKGYRHTVKNDFCLNYKHNFLNNQHIAEPTLYYLKRLAAKLTEGNRSRWRDLEGNVLLELEGQENGGGARGR